MQQLGVSAHDGEEIVEIVRDAAGKPTDYFHSLSLVQRGLGPLTFFYFELQASIDRLQVARPVIHLLLDSAGVAGA